MTIHEAIQARHSVRQYQSKPIPTEVMQALDAEITACNAEGNLHIQAVYNEPKAFSGFLAHYGKFTGVTNYIALIGKKAPDLDERIGYYGERIVLKAQMFGLNTCWVAMTMKKGVVKANCKFNADEALVCVLTLGYGTTQGTAQKSKPMDALCQAAAKPDWFVKGMEAAMLAPTAMHQQKFRMTLNGDCVHAESLGGFYSKVDLGIVKYHFEIGADGHPFRWAK